MHNGTLVRKASKTWWEGGIKETVCVCEVLFLCGSLKIKFLVLTVSMVSVKHGGRRRAALSQVRSADNHGKLKHGIKSISQLSVKHKKQRG
jgi:hypothetical protein